MEILLFDSYWSDTGAVDRTTAITDKLFHDWSRRCVYQLTLVDWTTKKKEKLEKPLVTVSQRVGAGHCGK